MAGREKYLAIPCMDIPDSVTVHSSSRDLGQLELVRCRQATSLYLQRQKVYILNTSDDTHNVLYNTSYTSHSA